MFEYKFVKLELSTKFRRLKTWRESKDELSRDHSQYAKEGWRLVQIFDPATSEFGSSAYFEMIFERPLTKTQIEQ
ncbi:MAG: DUF4177 domain-containing protein [Bacillaceae bacterium]|nr:DUF4177 domain-containing protein [Bacillaceae bacterium]